MPAWVLAIDERRKPFQMMVAGPNDFASHDIGPIDSSRLVDDPTLSLYCLDTSERTALFVRTPPQVDLSRAPFLYLTQYETATELVSVSFAELHRLAVGITVPSERLVLVQSTGRCGSTLVSQALAGSDDVVSLSEPDVYHQLHQLQDRADPELDALVKTCTILLCAPRPAGTWAVKFRSMNIELEEPLRRAFPKAKTVFLYRQADSWARSAARAYMLFHPQVLANWADFDQVLPRRRSLVDEGVVRPFPSPIELMSWLWSTSMLRALALQQAGVPMFIARYEELNERPREVLSALLEYCGIQFRPEALAAVIARDSQEGTEISRQKAQASESELTEERCEAFRQCLARMAPALDPDGALPGTYGI